MNIYISVYIYQSETYDITYREATLGMTEDFSSKTMEAKYSEIPNNFQVLKERNCQPQILYPIKCLLGMMAK